MDKKILRTLAVLTVGFGICVVTADNAAAKMTYKGVTPDTYSRSAPDASGDVYLDGRWAVPVFKKTIRGGGVTCTVHQSAWGPYNVCVVNQN